jgi:ATP-dependent protease HslVU (ClpYQ) peptidase subunit
MTCIVGLVDDTHMYIGGDAAINEDGHIIPMAVSKVFQRGDWLIGSAGSFATGQVLRHNFNIPAVDRDDIYEYMVVRFARQLRATLKRRGALTDYDSEVLALYGGRAFSIDADFTVHETLQTYTAIGSGSWVALGSLYSTERRSPHNRVTTALRAAARFNSDVCAPFSVIALPHAHHQD